MSRVSGETLAVSDIAAIFAEVEVRSSCCSVNSSDMSCGLEGCVGDEVEVNSESELGVTIFFGTGSYGFVTLTPLERRT